MYHYFYKITNRINGHYYYGVHSTSDIDDGYMGSGKRLKHAKNLYGIENFDKEIIKFFDSDEDAYEYESQIVTQDLVKYDNCYNCMLGGYGYHNKGLATVRNKEGNCFYVPIDDPRYLSGELVGATKGMMVVKDKDNNRYSVPVGDPRYLSGELFGITKGKVVVKDKNENIILVDKDDPRYLSGELVSVWSGKSHTDETKQKMKEKHKGNNYQKGENNSQYGTCWVTKDGKNKKISSDEIDEYLNQGYKKGRFIKPESENYKNQFVEKICPVCGNIFMLKKRYTYGNLNRCCSKKCSDVMRSLHNMHSKNTTWKDNMGS